MSPLHILPTYQRLNWLPVKHHSLGNANFYTALLTALLIGLSPISSAQVQPAPEINTETPHPLLPSPSVASAQHMATEQCHQQTFTYPQDTHQLVSAANMAADTKQYLQAVCQYRVATRRLPQQTTLRNNLSVLYYNHAVHQQNTAQNSKEFTQIRQWLTLSKIGLKGHSAQITQQAFANTYYDEAMLLRQQAQKTGASPDWQRIRQLLTTAIHHDPLQAHYTDALANTYIAEGIDSIHQGNLKTGIQQMEQGQSMAPQSDSIKMSLANAYLRQAQQASSRESRQQWVNKALQVSNNHPDIEHIAHQLTKPTISDRLKTGKGDQKKNPRGNQPIHSLPIQQQIEQLETALGIPTQATELTLPKRIKQIEKQVYGKTQKGPLNERVANAYQQILGRGQTYKNSAPNLIQQTIQTAQGSYLNEVFQMTRGRVIRWGRFPLKVCWSLPDEGVLTQQDLSTGQVQQAVEDGLNRWVIATGDFISLQWVEDENDADFIIQWKDQYTDAYSNPNHQPLGEFQVPTKSKLQKAVGIASMVTPGMYGLAPRAIMTGMQYRDYQKLKALREESNIQIGYIQPSQKISPQAALIRLNNLAAYEFGHTLGIKGNSKNPNDLMHPSTLQSTTLKAISDADIKTFKALYERPANIVLNID